MNSSSLKKKQQQQVAYVFIIIIIFDPSGFYDLHSIFPHICAQIEQKYQMLCIYWYLHYTNKKLKMKFWKFVI